MPLEVLNNLSQRINERQDELDRVLTVLESRANKESDWGKVLKVLIIVLGAIAATRDVAEKLYPDHQHPRAGTAIAISYTFLALLITVIAGITTAFRFESRAADLKLLAAECNSLRREIDGRLPNVDRGSTDDQLKEAREIIELQDKTLTEMEGKAARLYLNIVRRVKKLQTKSEQGLAPITTTPHSL
jgi:hypothetical protein